MKATAACYNLPMDELEPLLASLVAIDSVNPDLVPGARGEGEIAAFVADWLTRKGLEVHTEDSGRAGRPNVVAVARGTRGGRTLMLNSHMDTVGVAGMDAPFAPRRKGGRLYGRGAMDTKAALASFMCSVADARDQHLRGDVILAAVVDEEYASAGTEAVAAKWKADAAIVGEPTGLEIVTDHKGFVWFDIETTGVAAHGSLPGVGVDAIVKMGPVLVGIQEIATRLARGATHPSLGPGSIHASLIQGGQELSSYPASCRLSIERRTIPGEEVEAVEKELQDLLSGIGGRDPAFKVTLRRGLARPSLETPRETPIVQALSRQVRKAMGREPVFAGMGGWMDSALLAAAGIPAVIFGPSGAGLHGVEEWVDLSSVAACRSIITETIKSSAHDRSHEYGNALHGTAPG